MVFGENLTVSRRDSTVKNCSTNEGLCELVGKGKRS